MQTFYVKYLELIDYILSEDEGISEAAYCKICTDIDELIEKNPTDDLWKQVRHYLSTCVNATDGQFYYKAYFPGLVEGCEECFGIDLETGEELR